MTDLAKAVHCPLLILVKARAIIKGKEMSIRQIIGILFMALGLIWVLSNLARHYKSQNRQSHSLAQRVARIEGRLDILIPLQMIIIGAIIADL